MEVNKSIFKRQADFLEKNGKYILQFTNLVKIMKCLEINKIFCYTEIELKRTHIYLEYGRVFLQVTLNNLL